MYVPEHFRIGEQAQMLALMRARPFATLVTSGPSGLVASSLPTVVGEPQDGRIVIEAHFARANGHWRELSGDAGDALMIFHGPQGYVTPAWYPTKAETGKVVPTWNYSAVHAYGRAEAVDDPVWLRRQVEALTRQHEDGRARPWAVADAPASFIDVMLRGIVGLRLAVTRLEGKNKMSQNRSAADMAGVAAGLSERATGDDIEMAADVRALLAAKRE